MRTLVACVVLLGAMTLAGVAQGGPPGGFKCGECHSKNPKLLAMHKALDYSNCGLCHQTAVRSISAMRMTEAEKQNRASDYRCRTCHSK